MSVRPIDDAFLRFQRTGEPAALAVVFDGAAAELLRVASHLTHDLHAAEDLVQTTFLVAIEERRAYAPEGGVLAWLLGILVNRARRLRRETERVPDPDRLARTIAPGPHEAAEALELSQAVSDSLAALPEPYRPVLNLHLRHRLNAREIALALERPPGTVRTQLVRGLELLRRALPAGLAVGAAVAVMPARGLAAVRAAVLQHAASATPLAPALGSAGLLAFTGVLVMKKVVIVVVALAAVVSLLWTAWTPGDGESAALTKAEPVVAALPSPDAGTPVSSATTQTGVRQIAEAPATAASTTGWLKGRCVDEQGRGVAAAKIKLQVRPLSAVEIDRARKLGVKDPPAAQSAADGSFVIVIEAAGFPCEMTIVAPDRVPLEGGLGTIDEGQTVELGDVVLESGCRVTGRIVDTRGAAPSGAQVDLLWTGWTNGGGARLLPRRSFGTLADERGEVVFRDRVPRGTLQVSYYLKATGSRTSVPDLVIVRGQESAVLEIVCPALDELQSIAGLVVDESGVPVRGARISCDSPSRAHLAHSRSGDDGRFRILGARAVAEEAMVLRVECDGFATLVTPAEHHFGETDVTLVMKRPPGVELIVVEQGTGAPVEEFALRFIPEPLCFGSGDRDVRRVLSGRHPGGRVFAPARRFGRHLLVVEPARADLGPSRFHIVEVSASGAAPQRIELPRMVTRTLQVVRPDGSPVAGTQVELVAPTREVAISADTRIIPSDRLPFASSGMPGGSPQFTQMLAMMAEAILLQAGTTDAEGRLALRAGARNDLALHLRGPGHPALFVPRVDMAGEGVLRLEVRAGGRVEGRVGPVEIVRQLRASLRFIAAGDAREQIPEVTVLDPAKGLPIRDDGSFACEGIPPGDWGVYVAFTHAGGLRLDPIGMVPALRAGETRMLDADVRHLLPGRLHARVLVDGAPLQDTKVTLHGRLPEPGMLSRLGHRESHDHSSLQLTTDAGGAFEVELMPGPWRLSVRFGNDTMPGPQLTFPTTAVITPGLRVEHAFAASRVRLKVRVVDAATLQPVAARGFTVSCDDGVAGMAFELITDADGCIVLDPAPSGTFHLLTWPVELSTEQARTALFKQDAATFERAVIRLGPLQAPEGRTEAAVQVRLPAH